MDFLSQTACVEEQPDDFCKIFNDPIHGHVSVPGAIVQFIDTPQVRSFIATLIRREHTLQLCSRSPHVVLSMHPHPHPLLFSSSGCAS
tara:strand:- start:175 stop:438 length:264 start_codon:yes stop_codon:yes gene_type:complete